MNELPDPFEWSFVSPWQKGWPPHELREFNLFDLLWRIEMAKREDAEKVMQSLKEENGKLKEKLDHSEKTIKQRGQKIGDHAATLQFIYKTTDDPEVKRLIAERAPQIANANQD